MSRRRPTPSVDSYRRRLRLEGGVLAAWGTLGAALVLVLAPTATRTPISTAAQLAVVAVGMLTLGRSATRRALGAAVDLAPVALGSGEPTALWKLPLVVSVLELAFGLGAGWDAALRIGAGCLVVGLSQAVLLERVVAAQERRNGRRYYRVPGSRILTTRLGSIVVD